MFQTDEFDFNIAYLELLHITHDEVEEEETHEQVHDDYEVDEMERHEVHDEVQVLQILDEVEEEDELLVHHEVHDSQDEVE